MKTITVTLAICLLASSAWAKDAAPEAKDAATVDGKAVSPPPAKAAPAEPVDVKDAIDKGKAAIAAVKEGRWWYFSSLVCLILMFILKITKLLGKMGRWKYVVLPVLALASALLAAFQGGVSLDTAVGVFTTSWAMGMLEELWSHGILGKPHV